MAKRLTDTDKWKKPFIRTMKAPYKLLWLYILDECDHAGIWNVEIDIAGNRIGEKLNLETALKSFEGKIISFDNDTKWFVFDFIEFQYGELKINNRVHESVIKILEKYNIDYKIKPLISPLQGAKDKDKDKDKDKAKDKDKDSDPFVGEKFIEPFNKWMDYKKTRMESYKSEDSEKEFYNKLLKLSNKDPVVALEIINESMSNNWAGIFPLKNNNKNTLNNGGTKNNSTSVIESGKSFGSLQ